MIIKMRHRETGKEICIDNTGVTENGKLKISGDEFCANIFNMELNDNVISIWGNYQNLPESLVNGKEILKYKDEYLTQHFMQVYAEAYDFEIIES